MASLASLASSRTFFLKLSHHHHHHHQPPPPNNLLIRPLPPSNRRPRHLTITNCLISGFNDDFVSTRNSDREFSVIANMLKKIEPLDSSVISKGVSDAAKDSMKQTISTMLGLLPSDQFTVMVRVSKRPLDRLLSSSFITGYTLWNAEYRIMLMRNFEVCSSNGSKGLNSGENDEVTEEKVDKSECSCDNVAIECCTEESESERLHLQSCLSDFTPEAMKYIQQLESELSTVKKELRARKQENILIEDTRESDNDLLNYLRSLDPDMVNELSRPSSLEVGEVISELVQCTSRRFFKEDTSFELTDDSDIGAQENFLNDSDDFCDTIGTSRDYLAKLLFWCMLLGHHLRGLENRLHLSCAVGLL
ncbi:uncharacterized protein LOC143550129 [Bidens hawaiensis]|uniref:uncharacterized protein LOC143550129 n=1 Tax=Bidens hawaiensis TaxID=980011 RepID=UPI00404A4179